MGLIGYYNKMDRCSMSLPLMMALVMISIGEAQMIIPPCAEEITTCLDYLNSTSPPKSCCNPIKDVFATQLPCFCKFLLTPGILDAFGFNITQAIQFGHYCGVTINITNCQAAISALPPSSPVQPAATPGDDRGGAGRFAFTGLSFIVICLGYAV